MKYLEPLFTGLGIAAVILALMFGFGSCVKLVTEADKISAEIKQMEKGNQ